MRLGELRHSFREFLVYQVGLTVGTSEGYLCAVNKLHTYLELLLGRPPDVADLTRDVLQEWIVALQRQDQLGASTIHRHRAAATKLCRYLRRCGHLDADPMADVLAPRVRQRIPRYLEQVDAEALVAAPLELAVRPELAARDHAILWMLYEVGLRAAEAGDLQLDGLRWQAPGADVPLIIRVLGKGSKERCVPLRCSAEPLKRWLEVRSEIYKGPSLAVFLRLNRLAPTGHAMGGNNVSIMVRRYARAVGVKAHAHKLRHTAASLMLQGGAEIRALQDLLGHAGTAMTARYAQSNPRHLVRQGLDHHPCSGARADPAAALRAEVEELRAQVEELRKAG